MNDMRKWINLSEDDEGHWYSDEELRIEFISSGRINEWWASFEYVPKHELLSVAQDAFQKYMRWQAKPAWITDIRLPKEALTFDHGQYARGKFMWKVVTGPDDPDE